MWNLGAEWREWWECGESGWECEESGWEWWESGWECGESGNHERNAGKKLKWKKQNIKILIVADSNCNAVSIERAISTEPEHQLEYLQNV